MTPFRDEKGALVERVVRLEDELREARGARVDHARLVVELRELTERIESARTRGDATRAELDELSAAAARIRKSAGDPDAPNVADKPAEPDPATKAVENSRVALALVGGMVVVAGLVLVVSRVADGPRVTKPADPTSVTEARLAATKAGLGASSELFSMKAWYVSSDGTLHESPAYSPRVDFVFAVPPTPEPVSSTPRPIGAPGPPIQMFQDEYAVTLSPNEARVEEKPFSFRIEAAVPDPHCRLADVWKAAQAAGAPAEAVAIIDYADGFVSSRSLKLNVTRVPRWHFEIDMTPPFAVDISDRDCTVIR